MRRRNTRPLEPDRGGTSAKDRADGKGEGPGSSLTTDAKQCIKSWYRYADAGSYPQGLDALRSLCGSSRYGACDSAGASSHDAGREHCRKCCAYERAGHDSRQRKHDGYDGYGGDSCGQRGYGVCRCLSRGM